MNPAYQLMSYAWVAVAAWVVFVIYTNRKVHPRALFALFMVELWERFSYYGMRAILVLYMTSQLASGIKSGFGYDDARAYGVYGAYGALVYLSPILGGVMADKFMGFRRAIVWGAILMALGQFVLFLNDQVLFYIGLALLVVGNGFFKPNISSMIGRFYNEGDPRRDGAFTIFYMGINIGAFLTPLTCGAIGELEGWRYGFLAAGIGMLLGIVIFLWAQSRGWYEDKGLPPAPESANNSAALDAPVDGPKQNNSFLGLRTPLTPYIVTIALLPMAWGLIVNNDVVDVLLGIFGIGLLLYLIYVAGQYTKVQRQRIWVIIILLLFTTVFWSFFELAGSALNLFTERNVDRRMFGMALNTTFFQSVNPAFIMLFAPLFSWIWIKLANSGREPSAPYKFSFGLLLLGVGFLVLNLGQGSAIEGLVPAIFLVLMYMFHTVGELAISPVGLSLVTKLAPAQIVGFMMGCWFLSSSIAHQAGKHISKLTAVEVGADLTAVETLAKSMPVFTNVGLFAIGASVLLLLLSPMINRWMHGIK